MCKRLQVLRLNTPRMVALVEQAIQQGSSVLIENLEQSIDPVLAPVVGRLTIRRGRSQYLKLGDKEVSYNPNFRLFLQTRLSNPHYPPELQAECTLINFTVTEKVTHLASFPCARLARLAETDARPIATHCVKTNEGSAWTLRSTSLCAASRCRSADCPCPRRAWKINCST